MYHSPEMTFVPFCDSTNDLAFEALNRSDEVLIWTLDQRKGRGSRGRKWISPKNTSLAFSFGSTKGPLPSQFPYPVFAGLLIHQTLVRLFPEIDLALKWPNDVLLKGKKVCGILCESNWRSAEEVHTVLGIGINLASSKELNDIQKPNTSLEAHGYEIQAEAFLKEVLHTIQSTAWTADRVIKGWQKRACWRVGSWLEVRNGGLNTQGRFMGLSEKGHFQLQTQKGSIETVLHPEPDFSVSEL
ncbi:MAG: biotin--[acetyl-CoA-carboxylase] ligase [Acidobacteria bacterium]|nr:MAG: biotin--[acetyl-CoA-carboxylase] ligase [Acidobacteriota bacterium]PIE91397.1 MAG: biotin--[acetyl-CoA-carboxylase] ligase [Acidobacteriota bacterium]